METKNSIPIETETHNEEKDVRIIAGFWKRLFAFIIDLVLLGIFGMVLGAVFFDFLAELGPSGLLIGFTIAFLYFGIQNSSICNGQTIGKRILKIKVVNKEHETISVQRSFGRFMILGPPYFLNGAPLPMFFNEHYTLTVFVGIIVFFGLAGIIYLYIFNRKTRQSLHDLIVGTYVIKLQAADKESLPSAWKGHLVTLGMIFIGIILIITIVLPNITQKAFFKELFAIQRKIQDSGIVHYTKVTSGHSTIKNMNAGNENTRNATFFTVSTALKKRPLDFEIPSRHLAKIILDNFPSVMKKDALVINTSYGYDIGIASTWRTNRIQHTPQEWAELLSQPSE